MKRGAILSAVLILGVTLSAAIRGSVRIETPPMAHTRGTGGTGRTLGTSGAVGTSGTLGTPEPVLIELFTSEGCSSCPPADDILSDLVAHQPVANAHIVALGEHVDYWNDLGWTDPFSTAQFTSRQSEFGESLRQSSIFTPELVIDGEAQVVGSDRRAALSAIAQAASSPSVPIALAWNADGLLSVSIAPSTLARSEEVWLAVTEDGLESHVARGENAGRTLKHVAVTRRLAKIGVTKPDGSFTQPVSVIFDRTWSRAASHIVVFAQSPASRRINGVATIAATAGAQSQSR